MLPGCCTPCAQRVCEREIGRRCERQRERKRVRVNEKERKTAFLSNEHLYTDALLLLVYSNCVVNVVDGNALKKGSSEIKGLPLGRSRQEDPWHPRGVARRRQMTLRRAESALKG